MRNRSRWTKARTICRSSKVPIILPFQHSYAAHLSHLSLPGWGCSMQPHSPDHRSVQHAAAPAPAGGCGRPHHRGRQRRGAVASRRDQRHADPGTARRCAPCSQHTSTTAHLLRGVPPVGGNDQARYAGDPPGQRGGPPGSSPRPARRRSQPRQSVCCARAGAEGSM
jgi:hypothetical protein